MLEGESATLRSKLRGDLGRFPSCQSTELAVRVLSLFLGRGGPGGGEGFLIQQKKRVPDPASKQRFQVSGLDFGKPASVANTNL